MLSLGGVDTQANLRIEEVTAHLVACRLDVIFTFVMAAGGRVHRRHGGSVSVSEGSQAPQPPKGPQPWVGHHRSVRERRRMIGAETWVVQLVNRVLGASMAALCRRLDRDLDASMRMFIWFNGAEYGVDRIGKTRCRHVFELAVPQNGKDVRRENQKG